LLFVAIILEDAMVQRMFHYFYEYFRWNYLYSLSGPSSINPETNKPYGSSFPILSVEDFVRAQFQLIKHLGIEKV
jgi:hypothetical protein